MALRVGADIGGTFTDLAVVDDETGATTVIKVPSTPGRLRQGRDRGLVVADHRPGCLPRGHLLPLPRHDRGDQRDTGVERCPHLIDNHPRFSRRAGDPSAGPRQTLRRVSGPTCRARPAAHEAPSLNGPLALSITQWCVHSAPLHSFSRSLLCRDGNAPL